MNYVKLPELPEPIAFMDESVKKMFFEYALLAVGDLQRQLAALTEDYKDLEAQLMAVGAGGVSKLMEDKE